MALASAVIDDFNYIFDNVGDTEALYLLQNADTHLNRAVKMTTETVTFTSLVSGTQEYAMDDDILAVWSARYIRTSTEGDEKRLIETSVDELDEDPRTKNWRGQAKGEPTHFYIDGSFIGFYPKPSTASSASYPQVSIETTQDVTLTASSTMRGTALNHQAWVYHMAFHAALSRSDERLEIFRKKMITEEHHLRRNIHGRNARNNPRLMHELGMSGIPRV